MGVLEVPGGVRQDDHSEPGRGQSRDRGVIGMGLSIQIKVMARGCGHNNLNQFEWRDLMTWNRELGTFSGIQFAGTVRS